MGLSATLYITDSYDAVEMYKKAFGMTLGYHLSYEDVDGMKAWGLTVDDDYIPYKGYFHADLKSDRGLAFSVSGELDNSKENTEKLKSFGFYQQPIELYVNLGCVEAVKRAFDVLKEGGRVQSEPRFNAIGDCSACVIDRNNIWWAIVAN